MHARTRARPAARRHALRAPVAFDGRDFLAGGATVILEGDVIEGVEPFGYDVPADCPVTTYDGTLLPGLFDAHAHLIADGEIGSLERAPSLADDELDAAVRRSLREQAAAGVTTVRDLGDTRYVTLAHRDRAEPGLPRIVAAGPPITVADGHCHFLGGVASGIDDARRAVAEHHDHGVDVVKVMASGGMVTVGTDVFGVQFAPDELSAIVEAAHEVGLQVVAHAHSLAGIRHALDAGVDGVEHFTGLTHEAIDVPDEVLDRVAESGVVVDLTLGFDRAGLALMPGPPPHIRMAMERAGMDFESAYAARLEVARRIHARGIDLVAGADSGVGPLKRHGSVVLSVIDLLLADHTPQEALRTATSAAAAACGLEAVTGRLSPGLAADVLVVDGDLHTDLEPLHRPLAVLARGVDARD
ncbi:MAG TPA: amidohydrolase family protein [Marmoricola sp.]|nr:amidohydrolase family protein [Marmoricola sp.]